MDYLTNNRFTFDGKTFFVSFISSYQDESDYQIDGAIRKRFSVRRPSRVSFYGVPSHYGKPYPKGSIERLAYAAYLRAMNSEFSRWVKRNDMGNRGKARKAIR